MHEGPARARATLFLLGVALAEVAAARRPQQPPCIPAHYTVVGDPIGRDPGGITTIDVGSEVALGDACVRVAPQTRHANRAGVTHVRARWKSCDGLPGRVVFEARIAHQCNRLVGTIRARHLHRRVIASRSDCGDGILDATPPPQPFTATMESLATHDLPRWFDDAKFGIMIHWGIFTVPAWAETVLDPTEWLSNGLMKLLEPPSYGAEWFTHIPYTEWYPNTILIDGSPAQAYHRATYGADFPYENFRPMFESAAASWSAEPWASLFSQAGARYVVFVTKHHDGFALWPTDVPHPHRPGWHASRDFVAELAASVRGNCMRMGLYYSGGLDWSVQPGPLASLLDLGHVLPQSPEYIAYADAQWRELIARHKPALLWNDLGYPTNANALALFAQYYNSVPDGVINDRFTLIAGLTHNDYVPPE